MGNRQEGVAGHQAGANERTPRLMPIACPLAVAFHTRFRVTSPGMTGRAGPRWDAARVRQLRQSLRLSQRALADELGVRQQTVSDWETGVYRPRGASVRLLDIVAERASQYGQAADASERPPRPP